MTQASDAARGLTEAEILAGDPEANGVPATAAGESSGRPSTLAPARGPARQHRLCCPGSTIAACSMKSGFHELAAPPESGKGWIAQEARELLDRRLEDLDAAPAPPDRNQRLDESEPDEHPPSRGAVRRQARRLRWRSRRSQRMNGRGGTGWYARSVFAERPAESKALDILAKLRIEDGAPGPTLQQTSSRPTPTPTRSELYRPRRCTTTQRYLHHKPRREDASALAEAFGSPSRSAATA